MAASWVARRTSSIACAGGEQQHLYGGRAVWQPTEGCDAHNRCAIYLKAAICLSSLDVCVLVRPPMSGAL